MKIAGNILTLTVDLTTEFGPSSSGKTIIIASTRSEDGTGHGLGSRRPVTSATDYMPPRPISVIRKSASFSR